MKLEQYGMIGSQKGLNMLREPIAMDPVGRIKYRHIATFDTHEECAEMLKRYNQIYRIRDILAFSDGNNGEKIEKIQKVLGHYERTK